MLRAKHQKLSYLDSTKLICSPQCAIIVPANLIVIAFLADVLTDVVFFVYNKSWCCRPAVRVLW